MTATERYVQQLVKDGYWGRSKLWGLPGTERLYSPAPLPETAETTVETAETEEEWHEPTCYEDWVSPTEAIDCASGTPVPWPTAPEWGEPTVYEVPVSLSR